MSFLPFTRPSIDEDTIAAVGEVLRSGWITSGPKVKELEATLSARYGEVRDVVASAVFGATLVLLYTASTLYHAVPVPKAEYDRLREQALDGGRLQNATA